MKAELCNKIFISVINQYHINNDVDSSYVNPYDLDTLEYLLFEKCWIDTVQWHLEDLIRNPNIDSNKGLELKHRIDKSNQNRTDIVEKVDDYYFSIFKNTSEKDSKLNTESPGWVVDRLSILNLKIYHMNEQVERKNVTAEHILNCEKKMVVLQNQRIDLSNSFDELLEEYKEGIKKMKVYRQMKMYNDSNLNPELYQKNNN
ncbi:MAG: DUF4254 domain-containing protein [Flavobacteriales bacterium]|nr:DUF4254 domain-containing protein [Flavobacteriales bacterium]